MSRPATTPTLPTLPAHLATGDWVVLARADDGPLGFLGKVTDGEWDPRDDAGAADPVAELRALVTQRSPETP